MIGRVLEGRFRIVSLIARGAIGKVYRAEQVALGRTCAVKILNPQVELEGEQEFRIRFFREASIGAKLSHPNTVKIFDYGRTDDDVYFMAMEYLDGQTLHRILRSEGPFTEERCMHVARQISRSLREAHELGVIHRDLKPRNVYLVDQGEDTDVVKVFDFGLVKEIGELRETELTQAGVFVGSPKYMAPEQIRGDSVDARTDVYALGVVMYEMLAGKVPFERPSAFGVLMAHISDAVPPLRAVNPGVRASDALEAIIYKCLQKNASDRFASMGDVLLALKRAVAPLGAVIDRTGAYSALSAEALSSLAPVAGSLPPLSASSVSSSSSVHSVSSISPRPSIPMPSGSSTSSIPGMPSQEVGAAPSAPSSSMLRFARPPALPHSSRAAYAPYAEGFASEAPTLVASGEGPASGLSFGSTTAKGVVSAPIDPPAPPAAVSSPSRRFLGVLAACAAAGIFGLGFCAKSRLTPGRGIAGAAAETPGVAMPIRANAVIEAPREGAPGGAGAVATAAAVPMPAPILTEPVRAVAEHGQVAAQPGASPPATPDMADAHADRHPRRAPAAVADSAAPAADLPRGGREDAPGAAHPAAAESPAAPRVAAPESAPPVAGPVESPGSGARIDGSSPVAARPVGVLRFGAGMTRPTTISGAPPAYTREALLAKVEGTMLVRCVVTTAGALESCRVIKSLPHMDQAVLDAMATRRVTPILLDGVPVAAEYVFSVRLVMP